MSEKIDVPLIRKRFEQDLSAASIPLLMKRVGIDPALSSGFMRTTVTDVMGFPGFTVLFQRDLA